ncbi:glycosyltransferase family 2 protein [Algibacter sp. L3A6]|uniref:glycosyltransferase family 2 protein n=1 Tax=Algibacter sp. L3A6 TaxID=2686366 RepID=UPI00131EC4CD|nr:glycosyltransferase family 2 protein [Algibacter sp. L3A6]
MLSILIPTFNYNITLLVETVHVQTKTLNVPFEILCYDDGSTNNEIITENKKIENLENTTFKILEKNIGRSAIRNLLAKEANFEWVLFLDADVLPKNDDFIASYLKHITKTSQVINGGILYTEKRPMDSELLRWFYGKKREALSTDKRNKKPYLSLLTLNFLIKKNVFKTVSFDEDIPNLRHEDTLFSFHLKTNNINVKHIENPTYHLGLEESRVFLKKSLESVDAIYLFLNQGLIPNNYTLITKVFFQLKKAKLHYALASTFTTFRSSFERHLLSKKPSLYLFDIYRLSYLCYLDTN